MKNELDYSVFIERYLDGEMQKDEMLWFTRELKGNSVLKKELELRHRVNEAIRETEVMDFRRQLQEVMEKSVVEEGRHVHSYQPKKLAAAITLLIVIISASTILMIFNRNMNNQEIYSSYFRPAETGITFRAEGSNNDMELRTAMQYYDEGKYEKALLAFEKILNADSTRVGLNLYSGISQMEIKRYSDANKSFRKIIDNDYILYMEQAEWYLAFCYLMTNNRTKAEEQFAIIAERKGFYQHQARKILRRMR